MDSTPARTVTIAWDDPHVSAAAAKTLSGAEFLDAILSRRISPPPVARLLDMNLHSADVGRAVFELLPGEQHYNPIGMVHGGIVSTVLDSAMGCAIHTTLPAGVGYSTLELKVNFVRAVTHASGRLTCEGRVIHAGRSTAIAEATLKDAAGKLYAHGTCTCIILGSASSSGGTSK